MPDKNLIDELAKRRGGDGESFVVFGRVQKSASLTDEEYAEVCASHGRVIESLSKVAGEEAKPTFQKDRLITFLASDETVDSYGDILRVDGADLSRYKSGAAAFITSHDIRDVSGSCGLIVKAWKAKNVEGSPNGKALMVLVYFPTAEEDEDADYIFKKYKAGTLKAVSVGLQVLEAYSPSNEAERKALGLGKWGMEVRKWLPYELSAVTVGANPNALLRKGIGEDDVRRIVQETIAQIKSVTSQEAKPVEMQNEFAKAMNVTVNIKI